MTKTSMGKINIASKEQAFPRGFCHFQKQVFMQNKSDENNFSLQAHFAYK